MRRGGIVLCGGQSKRMGRPKAWLPFAGEIMLPRVVRLLREVVEPVIVVAGPDQAVPPLPLGVAVVRDEEKGRGPLQGLAAGLSTLQGQVEAVYLSGRDRKNPNAECPAKNSPSVDLIHWLSLDLHVPEREKHHRCFGV